MACHKVHTYQQMIEQEPSTCRQTFAQTNAAVNFTSTAQLTTALEEGLHPPHSLSLLLLDVHWQRLSPLVSIVRALLSFTSPCALGQPVKFKGHCSGPTTAPGL